MINSTYKNAFSGVCHSPELNERIIIMTNGKSHKAYKKGLILAIAIITVLLFGGITANAATNGAVENAVASVLNKITVFVNGQQLSEDDFIPAVYESVDEDGNIIRKYSAAIKSGVLNDEEVEVVVVKDNEGDEVYAEGYEDDINDELIISIDDERVYCQTTVVDNQ